MNVKSFVHNVNWLIVVFVSVVTLSSFVTAQEIGTSDVNILEEGGLPVYDVAAAGVSCYASKCNGVNPQGSVCQQSAYRVFGYGYPVGGKASIELWFSPVCKANWARLVVNKQAWPNPTKVEVWLFQYGSLLHFPKSHVGLGGAQAGYIWWSPMRDGSYTYEAWGALTAGYAMRYDGHTPGG